MPYWLRGGIIAAGITLIFVILIQGCFFTSKDNGFGCAIYSMFTPLGPVASMMDNLVLWPSIPYDLIYPVLYILSVALWFVVGSLIGLIIGYFKNKKEPTDSVSSV